MLQVHTGELQKIKRQCTSSLHKSRQLTYPLNILKRLLSFSCELRQLTSLQKKLEQQLQLLETYYASNIHSYTNAEKRILKRAEKICTKSINKWTDIWNVEETSFKTNHRFHHSIREWKTLNSYLQNGVCAGVFGSFHAYQYRIHTNKKYAQAYLGVSVGKISGNIDGKVQLYNSDKVFDPQLTIHTEAQGSLAELRAHASLGNSIIHGDLEGAIGVGVVKGEAKAVITKKEVTLKAEVGAAAIQGEVKGSISLFGCKITLTGIQEVGSVGAGLEFSSKTGEVEFGGRASFLAGLGFKVKINYG